MLSLTGILLDGDKQKFHLNPFRDQREIANGRNRCFQFNCGRLGACLGSYLISRLSAFFPLFTENSTFS